MRFSFLFFPFVILFLQGCTTIGMNSMEPGDLSKMHKVAVVSMVDSPIPYNFTGTTLFQNEMQKLEVPGWGIQKYIEVSLASLLAKNTQFQSVGRLKSAAVSSELKTPEGISRMLAKAASEGFDSVVVFEPIRDGNGTAFGLGINQASRFGIKRSSLYLLASLRVYDTKSKTSVAWRRTFDTVAGDPSSTITEGIPWQPKPSDLTVAELSQIDRALKSHISKELAYGAKLIGLVKN